MLYWLRKNPKQMKNEHQNVYTRRKKLKNLVPTLAVRGDPPSHLLGTNDQNPMCGQNTYFLSVVNHCPEFKSVFLPQPHFPHL